MVYVPTTYQILTSSCHYVASSSYLCFMKLDKEILRLSIPAIISNITVPILGLSDTTISGHLGSELYIGAIAVGTMMFNVVFWLFGFLRMGTTGLTAQAYGANDYEECRKLLVRACMSGLILGVAILLLHIPIRWLLLLLIAPEGQVADFAADYFNICIWGAPALLFNMAVMGWFLGEQNTIVPMIISVSVNIVNIILSLCFVFLFEMGFEGVAYGTMMANWIGVVLSLFFVIKFYNWRFPKVCRTDFLQLSDMGRFFKVNTDILFRSACVMTVSLTVTSIGAQLGALTLAANAIIMQFFILFSYFMDGFAFAAEALSGKFVGAKDLSSLKRVINRLLLWALGMAGAFTIVYICGYKSIVSFITNEQNVIEVVVDYSLWLKLIPLATVAAFIYDGIYIGLTATRQMLIVTFLSALAFLVICFIHPFADRVIDLPHNNTLWIAFLTYLLMRGILLGFYTKRLLRNIVKSS